MLRTRILLALLILPLLLGARAAPILAQALSPSGAPPAGSGSIDLKGFVRAVDGDTLDVLINGNQVTIGLIGIAAPMGNTPCGRQATAALQKLVMGGVHLDEDPSLNLDARQRRLYYARSRDGHSIALPLVQSSLVKADGNGRERNSLASAEAQARASRTGCLWNSQPGALAPALAPISAASPSVTPPSPISMPPGFTQEVVTQLPYNAPTSFTFLADGRMLVSIKLGLVVVVQPDGTVLPTPLINIQDHVNEYYDHGLLGMAADPNFANNGFLYLLYTYENDPTQFTSTKTSRLTRVTVSGNTASPSSEVVILGQNVGSSCENFPAGTDCIPADGPSHGNGDIKFAVDGSMYVTLGDASYFNGTNILSLRSQNLDSLAGKLLRIDTSGQGLPGNPFWTGDGSANRSKVWTYGLRNAYRFNLRPDDGAPFVGDVGWGSWEEVDLGSFGANLGWPCYEGNQQQGNYGAYASCQSLYAQGSAAVQFPLLTWDHCCGSSAVTGGAFYTGTDYPSQYQDAYFYADYGRNFLRYARFDAKDALIPGSDTLFAASGLDGPVDIETGPDNNIYYLSISANQIRRLHYTGGNTPPTAEAAATPTSGLAPLTVQFASAGTTDPDGDLLSYSWDFGDGTPKATTANPSHSYTSNGAYTATLTVDDGHSLTSSATVTITVGHRAPVVSISQPLASLTYKVGDVITYAGSATDPDSGTALPPSSLSWQLILHHCPGGTCHIHPFSQSTGAGGSFTIPDHGDASYFELILTAISSIGLTSTTSVTIQPQTIQVTLATVPSGLMVYYDGLSGRSPFTNTSIVGSMHTIFTQSKQGNLTFQSWSDG
ncbi:MAG: PQQ-dependent sugar dehydrogenase, partial [Dehalococcoidia bacterium]